MEQKLLHTICYNNHLTMTTDQGNGEKYPQDRSHPVAGKAEAGAKRKRKWTAKEEEVIEFLMGLIPILLEAKADLEAKNLLGEEFYGTPTNKKEDDQT